MGELNFSANPCRTAIFDAAIDDLQCELQSRLQRLHSRKADIGRLQELCEHLEARGWKAKADARAMAYTGHVVLRLFISIPDVRQHGALLEYFANLSIGVTRNESSDCGTDWAYDLALANQLRVLLRVLVTNTQPTRVPA